jgi:hypothetical protein
MLANTHALLASARAQMAAIANAARKASAAKSARKAHEAADMAQAQVALLRGMAAPMQALTRSNMSHAEFVASSNALLASAQAQMAATLPPGTSTTVAGQPAVNAVAVTNLVTRVVGERALTVGDDMAAIFDNVDEYLRRLNASLIPPNARQ